MKRSRRSWLLCSTAGAVVLLTTIVSADAADVPALDRLHEQAKQRVDEPARVTLADPGADALADLTAWEPVSPQRVPNYLRCFSAMPEAVEPLAELSRVMLYEGRVDASLKMAMGLRAAMVYESPYTAVHMARLLRATPEGEALLQAIAEDRESGLPEAQAMALRFAAVLTADVRGVDDALFRELRRHYDDGQIVELTMTVCYFNYFTRLVEALRLPVEPWALQSPASSAVAALRERASDVPEARVGLISDAEIALVAERVAEVRDPSSSLGSLGVGLANSIRAMARSPQHARAWGAMFRPRGGEAVLDKVMQAYISNEVSQRNRCEYCISHQVHKLRNAGVPALHIALVNEGDDPLTPAQRDAVVFARALTQSPDALTDGLFEAARARFGDRGVLEVVLVTCTFNFMNRFTSGLGLPPEAPAAHSVQEVREARRR